MKMKLFFHRAKIGQNDHSNPSTTVLSDNNCIFGSTQVKCSLMPALNVGGQTPRAYARIARCGKLWVKYACAESHMTRF